MLGITHLANEQIVMVPVTCPFFIASDVSEIPSTASTRSHLITLYRLLARSVPLFYHRNKCYTESLDLKCNKHKRAHPRVFIFSTLLRTFRMWTEEEIGRKVLMANHVNCSVSGWFQATAKGYENNEDVPKDAAVVVRIRSSGWIYSYLWPFTTLWLWTAANEANSR